MASFLPLPIKEEKDLVPSVLPKRKAALANIPTRARFAKARPNIGLSSNKSHKNTPLPEVEIKTEVPKEEKDVDLKLDPQHCVTVSASEDLPSEIQIVDAEVQPIKKEPELLQKPSVPPKRNLGISVAPRARYQKARPNIAALANKAHKDSTAVSVPCTAETKDAVDSPEAKESESQVDSAKKTDEPSCKDQTVGGKSVNGFPSVGEIKLIPEASSEDPAKASGTQKDNAEDRLVDNSSDILISDSQVDSSRIDNVVATVGDDVVVNEEEERNSFGNSAQKEMEKCRRTIAPTKKLAMPERLEECVPTTSASPPLSAPPTPSVSRTMEYPTLKSILNSPRKRTTTKKVYERKRRLANLSETPSRSEMTMTDLIYFNPAGEPMKVAKPQTSPVQNLLPADENTKPPEAEPEEEEESSTPVPKVIINENGEIIIDESSLVVRRKETIDTTVEAIIENDNTTYSSFRKRSSKQWTNKETSRFYKALSLVGTDFALMENIFTVNGKVTRSRRELKLKFKREEKLRIELVHKAMYETQTYDIGILKEEDPEELLESEVVDDAPKPKKRGRKPKETSKDNQGKPTTARKKKKKAKDDDSIMDEIEEALSDMLQDELNADRSNDASSSVPTEENHNDQSLKLDAFPRPQRARKMRILSDFVTQGDSEHSEEEFLPETDFELIAKEENVEINPESQSDVIEVIDESGEGQTVENIGQESVKPLKVRSRKKAKILETDPLDISDSPDDSRVSEAALTEVSRLGRVRKLRVLPDFITNDLDAVIEEDVDSDNESVIGFKRRKVMTLAEENEGEYLVESGEVFKDARHELVTQNQPIGSIQDIAFLPSINPNPTTNRTITNLTSSTNSNTSPVISSNEIGNLLQFPYQQENRNGVEDLLTDAVISEVVTTAMTNRRAKKKTAMPNVLRGKQRPNVEVHKQYVKSPSFTNFTPTEEYFAPEDILKTYSRMSLKPEEPFESPQVIRTYSQSHDVSSRPETLEGDTNLDTAGSCQEIETIVPDPETSSQMDHCFAEELKTISSLQAGTSTIKIEPSLSLTDIETITLDSGTETDQASSQINTGFHVTHPGLGVPFQNIQTAESGTLYNQGFQHVPSRTNQTSSDPPPVMIFTKSPNNENILHLFVMKSPDHSF